MDELDFDNPPSSPLEPLRAWVAEAAACTQLRTPEAMSLSTIDPDGRPSARIVLLRGLDERGAVFFTNYRSRKGIALDAHPRAALTMHWDPLARQIRIEGSVTRVSNEESDAYWATRPRESQISAWASEQSRAVASRSFLLEQYDQVAEKFADQPVPRPEHWGGYRVALEHVEFWQDERARMHDRIVYIHREEGWKLERLCP